MKKLFLAISMLVLCGQSYGFSPATLPKQNGKSHKRFLAGDPQSNMNLSGGDSNIENCPFKAEASLNQVTVQAAERRIKQARNEHVR